MSAYLNILEGTKALAIEREAQEKEFAEKNQIDGGNE